MLYIISPNMVHKASIDKFVYNFVFNLTTPDANFRFVAINGVPVTGVKNMITIPKGSAFYAELAADYFPTLDINWIGYVSFCTQYPGTAIFTKQLVKLGNRFTLYLTTGEIANLTSGAYSMVVSTSNIPLGISTDTVILVNVISLPVAGDRCHVFGTIVKNDGTPAGSATSALQNVSIISQAGVPNYEASAIIVTDSPVTFEIPTRSFNSSREANSYLSTFLNSRNGVSVWTLETITTGSVLLVNDLYVVSGSVNFPAADRWYSQGYPQLSEFSSLNELNAYINSIFATPGINSLTSFYGERDGGSSDVVTQGTQLVSGWKGVDVICEISAADALGTEVIGIEKVTTTTNQIGYFEFYPIVGLTVTLSCPSFGKKVVIPITDNTPIDVSAYF